MLLGDDAGEVFAVGAEEGGDFAEVSGAADGGKCGPGFLRAFGGEHGAVDVFDGAGGDFGYGFFGGGVDDRQHFGGCDEFAIDEHVVVFEA